MFGMSSGGQDGSVAARGEDGVAVRDLVRELSAGEARDIDVIIFEVILDGIDTIFL